MDYNILNRIEFQSQQLRVHIVAGQKTAVSMDQRIRDDQQYWMTGIAWNPVILPNPNPIPHPPGKHPGLRLSLGKHFQDETRGRITWEFPLKVTAADVLSIKAPRDPVPIQVVFRGTLVTIKPGANITDKEIVGFLLQDSSDRGQAISDEGMMDGFNNYLISQGGPDLRNLPFNLNALKALPSVIQPAMLKVIAGPSMAAALTQGSGPSRLTSKDPLALDVDEDQLEKIFTSDAIMVDSDEEVSFSYLKALASTMIERGWTKHSL